MTFAAVAACFVAYLLGAVPFGVIISKLWSGVDIRQYGSGNIGATNVFRVLGPIPGALVMLTDVLKGWMAIWLCRDLFGIQNHWVIVLAALLAIIGHNWSVFLKFGGGKGANTSLGVVIALNWQAAAICFAAWVVIVTITRYVSLASMIATVLFPISVWFLTHSPALASFGILASMFSIYRHRSNIKRLLAGTETKLGQHVEVKSSDSSADKNQ
jgi:glycerol-3-phosphate acyltransferase PlsY